MKIFITGGAGFIGSHIVQSYVAAGHEVSILDDLSHGQKELIHLKARFYQESLLSPHLQEILETEKPDIVNHHAAQIDVRKSVASPEKDANINIIGSIRLFEASQKMGVKKFIFASSGGAIYGNQLTYPADETHLTNPLSPYGITKLTIEKYLQFYRETYGIPFVALRYANVYGPCQNPLGEAGVVAIFIKRLIERKPLIIYGDGNQTRDYVYVGDVAEANLAAIEENSEGIFQVATGVETSVNSLARLLIQLVNQPGANSEQSEREGEAPVALPLEGATRAPIIEYAPARMGEQKRSCLKPGKIQIKNPTPLSEGLNKTCQWFLL